MVRRTYTDNEAEPCWDLRLKQKIGADSVSKTNDALGMCRLMLTYVDWHLRLSDICGRSHKYVLHSYILEK